jgi:hypothetical protein
MEIIKTAYGKNRCCGATTASSCPCRQGRRVRFYTAAALGRRLEEAQKQYQLDRALTSNLAFSEWGQVLQGERMTAALLDRLTHPGYIFGMNGESFRFRESMKGKEGKKSETAQPQKVWPGKRRRAYERHNKGLQSGD